MAYFLTAGNRNLLSIFPEGARTITGELKTFKKSAAILAKELGVKIIPAYISGSYEAWKPGTLLPRLHPIRIVFGAEHSAEELGRRGMEADPGSRGYEAMSLRLRREVLALMNDQ